METLLSSVCLVISIELVADELFFSGTNVYMLTLGDFWSSNTIDLYLHRR